ncbi:mitogen-activated protein kinase kinase kinase 13-B isoform X2 [Harmonia axyridis]|uniref:mitogen-activated protein kinase kinase kinase 13-B isoform X2 n=1 Tax=Harmonia axyridis TaxID=115357 RepID=UPI001E277D3F|nr:mitogen-activated protein kinase kinase kinase 13-B isoform X2 [Harmonia axyridis]XP_045462129.1 mitogen-activated protein kinase kinase kinase 13-B isoform X2 [Harmonia axyridis]
MHTPEGTLCRGQSPPLYLGQNCNHHFKGSVVSLPHLDLVGIPKKDECNNFTSSMLRIQSELEQFTIHKSSSEPAVAIDIPAKGLQNVSPFGTPDTPPPPYDIKQGWMTGIFGCLRPVLSIIGKGGHEIRNDEDDWEISFEQITDLTYLGCGGQGAVFSGKINNEPIAVKKVSDIKETDIKNLRKLNHPNIVKFKGVCTQAPCYSIIMEFCPYGPLFNLLKNQKNIVTTHRVVSWAKQIASGMTYLHAHKIIHRDLKSPNVLIGEGEVIKISDFGTSRTWNGVSEKMSFAGTVAWMSPEVIREQNCSEKVDVWSFGIVLWELLTCEVPYEGMEQSAIMYLVGCGKLKPPIPSTCTEGFKYIMQLCWKMNPKERPSFKLLCNHLEIASEEYLNKFKDEEFFATQESWKKEIKTEMTQFKAYLQKHKMDIQNEHEQLLRTREMEIKHIRDIRELYYRKLEKVVQMQLELTSVKQQWEVKQCGRKRELPSKTRFSRAFMKKNERRKSTHSTTPTSPEHSLTSPDSPQICPQKPILRPPVFTCLEKDCIQEESEAQTSTSLTPSMRSRKRHHRTSSGSPRNSSCSRSSSYRNSMLIDIGTQTDYMDYSETDMSPISQPSSVGPSTTKLTMPRRVILEQKIADENEDEGANGNGTVQLHYMLQPINPGIPIFTRCSSSSMDQEDNGNCNNADELIRYSDEDNLETLAQKVSALKNGNIFMDLNGCAENGNLTDHYGNEITRKRTTSETRDVLDSTEDAANEDSYTDEEGETYNHTLKRKSLTRRPIYPGRRSGRYKSALHFQRQQLASDEGNTSEYSVSPSSKSSTLESINTSRTSKGALKRPNDGSDSSSDSDSEENLTVVTQVPCS